MERRGLTGTRHGRRAGVAGTGGRRPHQPATMWPGDPGYRSLTAMPMLSASSGAISTSWAEVTMAPRMEPGSKTMPSSAPRRSTLSMVTPVRSVPERREPGKAVLVSFAALKSTSRSTQLSNVTSVSSASRKFTESSLQPRNTTRRRWAPNASTPAAAHLVITVSTHSVPARLVTTIRTSLSHADVKRAPRSRPSRNDTLVKAHSRNRLPPASGSPKSTSSKWAPSYTAAGASGPSWRMRVAANGRSASSCHCMTVLLPVVARPAAPAPWSPGGPGRACAAPYSRDRSQRAHRRRGGRLPPLPGPRRLVAAHFTAGGVPGGSRLDGVDAPLGGHRRARGAGTRQRRRSPRLPPEGLVHADAGGHLGRHARRVRQAQPGAHPPPRGHALGPAGAGIRRGARGQRGELHDQRRGPAAGDRDGVCALPARRRRRVR